MRYILVFGALVFGVWFAVHEMRLIIDDIKRKNAEKKAKKAEKANKAEQADKAEVAEEILSDNQPVSEEKNTDSNL